MARSAIDPGPGLVMSRKKYGRRAEAQPIGRGRGVYAGQRALLRCWIWANLGITLLQPLMVSRGGLFWSGGGAVARSILTSSCVLIWLTLLGAHVQPVAAQGANIVDPSPDANSAMPRCGPPMDGQVFCRSGIIYECQFVDPNSMERRTGWRWKADILRGCAEPEPGPDRATAEGQGGVSPAIIYAPAPTNGPTGQHGQPGAGAAAGTPGTAPGGTMRIRPGPVLDASPR
jgi:hypothetical protein